MEARGRSGGFGFPGYDGSLPRAVRSSRGRCESQRKPNNPPKDMDFFELLATVAEQLLQHGDNDEREKENPPAENVVVKTEGRAVEGRGGEDKPDEALLKKQRGAMFDVHLGGNEKTAGEDVEIGEERTRPRMDGESVNQYCKIEAGKGLIISQSNLVYKSSFSRNLEKSDDSVQQEVFRASPTKCTAKTMPLVRERDSVGIALQGLLQPTVCVANVEDVYSSKMKDQHMCIENCSRTDGAENCEDVVMSDLNQLTAVVQTEVASGKPDHGFVDTLGHAEGKGESEPKCSRFKGRIEREEGSNVCDGLMLDDENPPLVSSGSSEEAPPCVESKPCEMYFDIPVESREVARSTVRDDDDNTSESFVPETKLKKPSRISFMKALKARRLPNGNTRNRTSVPGSKRKHAELEENKTEKSGSFHGNGMACTRQRTPRWLPSKKKILQGSTCVAPELHVTIDNLSSLGFSNGDGEPPASAAKLRSAKAASVASSPTSATNLSWKNASKKLGEPHVKVSIKSFTVPELSVDLPESATVANLKRAVMEAAMNLLGGGLHVRVLLQGKKVPDESATLVQVGISRTGRPDSLGFMLEPNRMPTSPTSVEDPLLVLSRAASQPVTRYPVFSMGGEANQSTMKSRTGKSSGTLEADTVDSAGMRGQADKVDQAKSDLDQFPHLSHGPLVPGSGALILHPGLKGEEGLALVQMQQKSRSTEIGKRRMRRPFTVAEVEALVQAVEILGTGRWRDVKLRAFDQAKHRTYVDLKDKWKTLVHTARIAPHQRRGEPVPQELLDRVIHAHTYWATQQAKQQADLGF